MATNGHTVNGGFCRFRCKSRARDWWGGGAECWYPPGLAARSSWSDAHMSRAAHWPAPLECAKQHIADGGDCDQTNRKKDGLIGVAASIEQPSRDRRSGRGDEKITAEEDAHSESAALGRNRFGCQRHDDAGRRRTHQSERQ